jgi:hypothetical protein
LSLGWAKEREREVRTWGKEREGAGLREKHGRKWGECVRWRREKKEKKEERVMRVRGRKRKEKEKNG